MSYAQCRLHTKTSQLMKRENRHHTRVVEPQMVCAVSAVRSFPVSSLNWRGQPFIIFTYVANSLVDNKHRLLWSWDGVSVVRTTPDDQGPINYKNLTFNFRCTCFGSSSSTTWMCDWERMQIEFVCSNILLETFLRGLFFIRCYLYWDFDHWTNINKTSLRLHIYMLWWLRFLSQNIVFWLNEIIFVIYFISIEDTLDVSDFWRQKTWKQNCEKSIHKKCLKSA